MSLKIRGLAAVQDQLKEISSEMSAKVLPQAMRASFKKVQRTARELAPVDSGDLRDAIRISSARPKTSRVDSAVVGIVIAGMTAKAKQARVAAAAFNESQTKRLPPSRRWHFIELGTKHQAPRPFLRPALDQNAQAVVDDLAGQLRKKIAKAIKAKSKGASK